jgi:uncharacterized protein DUF5753/helix-turn-helix protein
MGARKLVTVVQSGLADELRDIRDDCDMSLEDVCGKLMWQQSKLSRMENGQQCISDADLGAVLAIYGVHGDERRRLLRLAERQDDPGRWEITPPDAGGPRTLARLELKATTIINAEPLLVPGLVQTRDYATTMVRSGNVRPEMVERRIDARLARQSILTKNNPPKVDLILDEMALRRVVGSPKIMALQLRAILEVAERPNVRFWVLPFKRDGSIVFDSSFHLMDFSHGNSVVLLENIGSCVFREEPEEIDFLRRRAARLAKLALNPADSISRLATIAKEHERE